MAYPPKGGYARSVDSPREEEDSDPSEADGSQRRSDKDGNDANTGFMVAFDRGFMPVKDSDGNEYNRWVFAADYASGNNALGGGGFGVYRFFTKDICLLTGPVWFNETAINGEWKWTIQLDINL